MSRYSSRHRFGRIHLLAFLVFFTTPFTATAQPAEQPANVILLIGDGMGLAQMSSISTV